MLAAIIYLSVVACEALIGQRLRYFLQRDGVVLNMLLRIFLRVITQSRSAQCPGKRRGLANANRTFSREGRRGQTVARLLRPRCSPRAPLPAIALIARTLVPRLFRVDNQLSIPLQTVPVFKRRIQRHELAPKPDVAVVSGNTGNDKGVRERRSSRQT